MEKTFSNRPDRTSEKYKLSMMKWAISEEIPNDERESTVIYRDPEYSKRRSQDRDFFVYRYKFNRTEKVCTNRGLKFIENKRLCSDSRKDAFDMRNLKESLPSTSVSEMEKIAELRQRSIKRLTEKKRRLNIFLEEMRQNSLQLNLLEKELNAADISPSTEKKLSCSDCVNKSTSDRDMAILRDFHQGVLEKQKQLARMTNFIQNKTGRSQQTNRHPFYPGFDQMSLNDNETEEKKMERQNAKISWLKRDCVWDWGKSLDTDFLFEAVPVPPYPNKRNALLSTCSQPGTMLPQSLNSDGKSGGCSHWDSKTIWNADFKVPHNSPDKDASNSMTNDSIQLVETMCWKSHTLNSTSGVVAEDLGASERNTVVEMNHDPIPDQFSKHA